MRFSPKQQQLVERWWPLVKDLDDERTQANTAAVLENQENYFNGQLLDEDDLKEANKIAEAGGTASTAVDPSLTGIARLKKVVIPMVRRTFPALVANDILGVQPMSGPVGLAYALRYRYQDSVGDVSAGDEAGYNTIDREYSGPYTTEDAERLNAPNFEGGSSGDMREMGLDVERQTIEAKSRKLKARWSLEAEQDLENMHGMNVEDELTDVLQYQLSAEMDREILYYLKQVAQWGGVYSWSYTTGGGAGADGRWEQEIFRTFYTKLLKASNEIAQSTRRGPGNFIVASPGVVTMLESLGNLNSSPIETNLDTNQVGSAEVGTIGGGRFTVYRDLFAQGNDYAVVGYKGPRDDDSGLVFCPYVPVMFSRAVGEENFQPRLGVMTRYAIADHLFGAENYYRYVDVDLGGSLGSYTAESSGSSGVPYTTAG